MNVLVYNGPGVSQTSLAHTLSSLKALLLPHFAVQTISAPALTSQPWANTCALLVIPGGRDLPYVSSLANANTSIISYVQHGGAYLGICAGAYYASRRIEWESGTKMEVSGDRPLGFFGGICKGSVYPGFAYESENGARAVSVEDVEAGKIVHGMYHNGGGEFVGAESLPNTTVLARYTEGEGEGKVAAVYCRIGKGSAILWGTHPEYSLDKEPLLSALKKRELPLSNDDLKASEEYRWTLLRKTLTLLGVKAPAAEQDPNKSYTGPLPQFLTSSIPSLPGEVYKALAIQCQISSPLTLHDSNDTFRLHNLTDSWSLLDQARKRPEDEENVRLPKAIIFCEHGSLPNRNLTPKFSVQQYYSFLSAERSRIGCKSFEGSNAWGMGELFIYGEAVTSTQTLLDKNPLFLRSLPAPLLSLATHQLLGRGRGSNIWLSPAGCLQFSLLLRPSLSEAPAARLVFVQYLFALAVVEACRDTLGDNGEAIRLKWPNDIYALVTITGEDGQKKEEPRKIGGILVSTNFSQNQVDIVIGCGINVLNPMPTTSLSQLNPNNLSMENLVTTIMAKFEIMWEVFLLHKGSFHPFEDLYLERWLHSDQLVTLTTVNPPLKVRVLGITHDYGLLRTIPEGREVVEGQFIDLQPDGNSFDMMAGLIKRKT